MSKSTIVRSMDLADISFRFIVWCSKDGTNDGTTADTGYLQGATISTSTWTLSSGLTNVSDNINAVTINGVSYGASTVATIKLSVGATATGQQTAENKVVLSDGRTENHTIIIPIL